jgi:hypothetical protein
MPRHCKSFALKKIKPRNWLMRAPGKSWSELPTEVFFACQVLGPRIFFLNRIPKSAIGVSSDPKPILNPTLVHLLCFGLRYCLWDHVAVFGWMVGCLFGCVHACKQFFVLLTIMSLWLCKFCSMALGYAYPAYECFKIVERNRPDLEDLRFWCQYWYPPSTHAPHTCLHGHSFHSHIFILLSLFQLLQYKREVGAVQEPFLSLSERIRSPTWEGASKSEHNPHAQEELPSQEHICNKCSASCYLVCSSGNFWWL